jgi:hypothetical protein
LRAALDDAQLDGLIIRERVPSRHKQMPQLVTGRHLHAHPKTAEDTDTVGAAA